MFVRREPTPHQRVPNLGLPQMTKKCSTAFWKVGSREMGIAGVEQGMTGLGVAWSTRLHKRCPCGPDQKGLKVKLPEDKCASWSWLEKALWTVAITAPGWGSPSLHVDVNRAEGHRGWMLAGGAVRAQGRRGGWLGALGLQLPPCPHFPVMRYACTAESSASYPLGNGPSDCVSC